MLQNLFAVDAVSAKGPYAVVNAAGIEALMVEQFPANNALTTILGQISLDAFLLDFSRPSTAFSTL